VVFSKPPSADWFVGGTISFDWAGVSETFSVKSDNIGAIRILEDNTIAIDLNTAFGKASGAGARVMTSGNITIDVAYSSVTGWAAAREFALDRARPVLAADAVWQIGRIGERDTLTVTYSEALDASALAITVPVIFNGLGAVSLEWIGSKQVDLYTQVTYVVTDPNVTPKSGDSLQINHAQSVADNVTPPNAQKYQNRRVALTVKPGEILWETRVKNNPFRDFTTVVMTPNYKGDEKLFSAQIKMYDNMGRLVVDTVAVNDPKTGNNALEWTWRGRNRQGRTVGTGTYIFKAVCIPAATDEAAPQRYYEQKRIGFVRGKAAVQ
jgi:hypothetical protein